MTELVTNGSINFERVTQAQLGKVEKLHDKHSKDIEHDNDTIDHEDTELNYHATPLNLNELLNEQYGEMIAKKNAKLDKQLKDGKISNERYEERHMTIDKYLNHSGKEAKTAFTLGVVYVGDDKETKDKLDKLGFDYEVKRIKGKDGQYHNHFHLTNSDQRKQWRKVWIDTFKDYVDSINNVGGGLKVFDYTIHLDEASPHLHMKMLNMGHSKTGRPSYNLNQALNDFLLAANPTSTPALTRATSKTPKQRISGSETMRRANAVFSQIAVMSFQKHTGINVKYQKKGDKAKLTNQMTPEEFKQYKANMQALHDTYVNVTGKQPNPSDTPLKMSDGIRKASEAISEDKKAVDDEKDQLNQKRSEIAQMAKDAQFNSFVQHQFIMRLEERRKDKLRKLKQREEELKQQESMMVENATQRVVEAIKEQLQHILDDIKLAMRGQLDAFNKNLSSAAYAKNHVDHNAKYNSRRIRNIATNLQDNKVIGTIAKNAVNDEVKNQQPDKKQDNEKDEGLGGL